MRLKTRKGTAEKYLSLIQDLSTKNETIYTNVRHIGLDYNVGNQYVAKLRDKNYIIIDENGYYKWNKTVNPSVDIVKQILKELSIEQQKYVQQRKEKSQIKIVFNEPEKKIRNSKKRQLNQSNVQPQKSTQSEIQQIGLIRKFIKFIW